MIAKLIGFILWGTVAVFIS